jgi:cell division protein FtsN
MILDEGQPNNLQQNAGNMPGPKKKSTYILELDKAKIFWSFILTLLVLTFVFVFGYWTGQYQNNQFTSIAKNVDSPEKLSLESQEINEILGEEKEEVPVITGQEKTTEALKDDIIVEKKQAHEQTVTVEKKEQTVTRTAPSREKKTVHRGEKKYAIQLASFKEQDKALHLREQLLGKGYGGYVIKQGTMYKVRVGNFYEYNRAANTLSKVMRVFGINDAYIFKLRT